MGDLNFEELQDEVRAGLGKRTDLDSRLGRFVNMAQQRLARTHDFDEMEVISTSIFRNTGSDNDRFLQLPTLREIYSIVLLDGANSRRLEGRTPQFMDTVIPKPEYWSRDRPHSYTVWGTYIELWPLPNGDYPIRVRWTQWPSKLVNSTDYSMFLQKDDVLIEFALSTAFYSLGKEEEGAKHEMRARGLLEESREVDRTRPDINVKPGPSVSEANSSNINPVPWLDPFNKTGSNNV